MGLFKKLKNQRDRNREADAKAKKEVHEDRYRGAYPFSNRPDLPATLTQIARDHGGRERY